MHPPLTQPSTGYMPAEQPDETVKAAALALFAAERDRIQKALVKNFAAVSAKRKAEAQGLSYDYATGQVHDPAAAAKAKKSKGCGSA
jgi:hypothetical protein